MNTAEQVKEMIDEWLKQSLTKTQIAYNIAYACIGWPYVWGGYGHLDTPSNRRAFANRSSCPPEESALIISGCQALRQSGSCNGCKYFPGDNTRFFDCRGFTRWVLGQVGVTIEGGGATAQWNTNKNWTQRGELKDMPRDKMCCLFMKQGSKMSHTGLYLGNEHFIHCSGEVKEGVLPAGRWTHYAIPVGLEGDLPPMKPTLRKGSSGPYVTECQTLLISLGYDLSPYGADGKYGNKTIAAIKDLQSRNSLTADGVCGPKTWAVLESAEPGSLYSVAIKHVTEFQLADLKTKFSDLQAVKE